MNSSQSIRELVSRFEGVLRLNPVFMQRFYHDGGRLGQKPLKTSGKENIPERWIGSSVEAVNRKPLPPGGLSMLARLPKVSLRDAVLAAPKEMIGEELFARHGAAFRVLVKLLDPGEPIPFHLHATDQQVKSLPKHFRGHSFGKDEAYYFPEVTPKGPLPYTHVGLYDGVTRSELLEAVRKGRDYALELSPVLYQRFETGFFVPAGVPHSPGTALTLEIQQPSDVYTLLETVSGGKVMSPQQIHPGFKSLDEAFQLVDFKQSKAVGRLAENFLPPQAVTRTSGGEVAWIFPLDLCQKFGGKRIRVNSRVKLNEPTAAVTLIWRGRGKLNGQPIRAGDEFFLTADAMKTGIEFENTGDEQLEAFVFFPGSEEGVFTTEHTENTERLAKTHGYHMLKCGC